MIEQPVIHGGLAGKGLDRASAAKRRLIQDRLDARALIGGQFV
jgi:hypothetical protein